MERIRSNPQIENNKYFVMSHVYPVGVDDEGNFDWAPAVWLTYHESFRREIARLTRAVDRFDPVQDAWKAIAMYRWLTEFFIPIIRHYEMGKRLFTVPYYTSKGHIIPDELNYSETFLQDFCTNIPVHAKEILDMAMSENLFPKKIKESVMHFKQEIHDLSKLLTSHYDAEERFWPAVYEKEGLEVWQKILYRMLVYNRKVNAKASNHIFAMVFHSIGYNLKYLSADDPLDTPWCGSKTRYTFVKRSPFIVKALPLVKWMQDYLKFKGMINAVFFQLEDEQDFERRYRLMLQKQLHHQEQQEKWSHWMFNIFGHRYQHEQNQSINSTNTVTTNIDMKKLDNTANIDAVYSFSMMDDNVSARSARSSSHHSKSSTNKNNSESQMIAFAPEFQHAGSDVATFMNAEVVNSSSSPRVTINDPSIHKSNANNSTSSLTQTKPKKRNSSIWSLLFFRHNSQWSSSNLSVASTQSSDNNTNPNTTHGTLNTKSINNTKYNEKIEEETVETHALWAVKKQPSNSDATKGNLSNHNSNSKILPVS